MEAQKMIFIKRRIEVDDYLREFIFFNINYRRNLWNKFVEEYYKCGEDWDKYDINKLTSQYTSTIDKEIKESSEYYNVDVVKSVSRDMRNAMKRIKDRTINEHRHFSLNFKGFDRYKGVVKVPSRNIIRNDNLFGKVHFKNNKKFEFRAHRYNHFDITSKEPFYDEKIDDTYCIYDKHDRELHYYFKHEDIKEIVFIHELGKFYIALSVKVTYINNKEDIKKRKKLAGLDLGIHNPITLYDGEKTYSFSMSDKELNKIHYLERRCRRLQNIMDRKMRINIERRKKDESYNIYTRSYERVRRKFRRSWKRIFDIRCNWRRKLAKFIATHFQSIVVDEMKQPTKSEQSMLPRKVSRYINHFNRKHAMYLFTECLKHACEKYGCEYINAPKGTTKTCCLCKHENPKLPLFKRKIHCEKCGNIIDRDMNAAINCYDFYQNR